MNDGFEVCLSMLAMGAMLVATSVVRGDDKQPVSAKDAFARLKSMAGTWSIKMDEADKGHHPADGQVVYRLTGAGSALIETLSMGSDHEMTSIYHLDGDDLRMTHYCDLGNQPHLKLDRAASCPDKFFFVFDGGTNLDPAKDSHIHALSMSFEKDGKVACACELYEGGKKAATHQFEISRCPK
jgi:hypothetical protein